MILVTAPCAGAWTIADANSFDRHPLAEIVNLILECSVFASFGVLLATLRRELDRESELARTDVLTEIENRRSFWEAAERELERCRRFQQPFALVYVDVDDFKSVNDRLGHRAGDELLRSVADVLRDGVRKTDVAARIGGDEFALLLTGTDSEGARIAVEKLWSRLGKVLPRVYGVHCSIGCLSVVRAPEEVADLIARADAIMYGVKRCEGRSPRFRVHPDEQVEGAVPQRPAKPGAAC
ncbi:MAG: hypothetical protein Fur0037_16140 [Planctomycetota bacterium]